MITIRGVMSMEPFCGLPGIVQKTEEKETNFKLNLLFDDNTSTSWEILGICSSFTNQC